jgi:hypothetical protein
MTNEASERYLRAYHYEFAATGDDRIDAILEAVAMASKAYHNTGQWTDEEEYGPAGYWSLIQDRANKAVRAAVPAVQAPVAWMVDDLLMLPLDYEHSRLYGRGTPLYAAAPTAAQPNTDGVMASVDASIKASGLINDLEYAVLARAQGLPGSAEKLSDAKQAIRDAIGVPGLHPCGHMKGSCQQCHQCLRDQGATSCPTCEPASGVALDRGGQQ